MKKSNAFIPIANNKSISAKARKLDAEAKRIKLEAREKEDQQWRDTKSRATKRREEKAERQAEASARKASARLLAKQEEEDLELMLKKETTEEQKRKREEDLAAIQKKVEEEKRKQSRVATKKEYERMILVENKNRAVIEADSFDEAIAVLTKRENLQVRKVKATLGNKRDCLLVYTQGEEKPLLIDVLLTV